MFNDYHIQHTDFGILVHGPIPVEEFSTLTKLWLTQGYDTLATSVSSALGATFAMCRADKLAPWEAEVNANAVRQSGGSAERAWLKGTDTGLSAKSIFSVLASPGNSNMIGGMSHRFGPDVPHDPSDFGRCHRLLEHFPGWRERLGEVAAAYAIWYPFVEEWDYLTALYEEESPSGKCPRLYDVLQIVNRLADKRRKHNND